MSEPTTLERPRQVTLAAWMIIAGSVLVVVAVFDRIATLHQLETQDALRRTLSEPPVNGLGLDFEAALTIVRIASMVAGGCAAAAVILGVHVLRRNRGARLALTVLALPIFLSGPFLGGFLSSLVAVSAVLLWLEPSRDWFNGKAPRPRPQTEPPPPTAGWPPPLAPPDLPPGASGPRPHQGFGSVPSGGSAPPSYAPPPPGARPYDAPPPPSAPYAPPWQAPPPRPAQRPAAVVVACICTWVFSSLVLLAMAGTALIVATIPDQVFDEMNRQNADFRSQGMSEESFTNALYLVTALVVAWSLSAILLAVLAFRRSPWARVALLASAGGAAGLCLLGSLQFVPMMVPLFACIVTFSLLLRPDVRAWFAAP